MLAIRHFELFNFATWGIIFPVIAWIASVFTFVYSFYFVFKTFAGKRKSEPLPKHHMKHQSGCSISLLFLATLVVGIFFIPNLIGKWLVKPAVMAVQPGLYNHPSEVAVHVAAWHGFDCSGIMDDDCALLASVSFYT